MDTKKPVYTVIIMGEGGCGKTSYIKRLATGEFLKSTMPTASCVATSLTLNTSHRSQDFKLWDCGLDAKVDEIGPVFSLKEVAGIVMFDVTNIASYRCINIWIKGLEMVGVTNIVVVGNKADAAGRKVKRSHIQTGTYPYVEMSVKDCENLYAPLTQIFKQITGTENVYVSM